MRDNPESRKRRVHVPDIPIYPVLFGIYPILALAGINISQIDFSSTYRTIALSVVLAAVIFLVLRLVMRNWMRAALLTFLLLVLFFSYGHVYNILKNPVNPFLGLVRHRILGPIWLGLAGLAIWYSTRKFTDLASITRVLNYTVLILFVFPAIQIGQFQIKNHAHGSSVNTSNSANTAIRASQSDPDIYYIILDGYMRADNIQVVYGFDNSAFINSLTQRGFYVANCSQSNYAYTEPSLASSLNINYLDSLGAANNTTADPLINNNSVRQFLESHGYKTVAFETGFAWSQWEDADVYYKYVPPWFLLKGVEVLFLQTTAFRILMDKYYQDSSPSKNVIAHDRTIDNLNNLKQVPDKVKGPKFIFAHLIIPHPPFIYSPNGDYVAEGPLMRREIYDLTTPGNDKPGYFNSISFINSAILKIVDNILAESKIPPVIIIQGDHGAFRFNSPDQRMSILNAYYFPDAGARAVLYPSITPVNTFRIILDSYFKQTYPLLPDVSWYSPTTARWTFENVPNQCQ